MHLYQNLLHSHLINLTVFNWGNLLNWLYHGLNLYEICKIWQHCYVLILKYC